MCYDAHPARSYMKEHQQPNNPEGSRSPENNNPPERTSRESLWRGLRWIGVGTGLLAISKLTGDEAFYHAGLPITVLGGNEVLHALLGTLKK
jgi:hypothetical protein